MATEIVPLGPPVPKLLPLEAATASLPTCRPITQI